MCNAEAPSVEEVATKFAGKVDIYGVAWYGDAASYQGFVDKHHVTFPTLMDQTGDLYAHFQVPGQPAWVFVGADGKAKVHVGTMEKADVTAALDGLAT